MSSRSRATRTTQASSLGLRRPQRVIRQIAPSSRGVPLPIRASLSLAGRRRSSLLHLPSSDGAHGVLHTLRRFTPSAGWTRHACFDVTSFAAITPLCSRCFDISAGPGPRAVRASASAPIDFRRGDRSPVGVNTICKSDRPGMRWRRLLGFDSRLRSVAPGRTFGPAATILPWALPLAGLSGTQNHLTMVAVHRPGSTPLPITNLRNAPRGQLNSPPTVPIRSWAFSTILPITRRRR
jgi:hypothetical protein